MGDSEMKTRTILFCAAALCGFAAAAGSPREIQWGVTFGFYAPTGYMGSDKAKEEIDAIAAAGALLRHVHIADYQTRMFPGFDKHETWRLKPFFAAASTASRGRT